MANATIQLRNLTTNILSLDLGKVGLKRTIRSALDPAGTTKNGRQTDRVDVGDLASLSELSLNSDIVALIETGKVLLTPTRGSSVIPGTGIFEINDSAGMGLLYGVEVALTAGGGGSPDDVTVISALPFAVEVVDSFLNVATAVTSETVTLRTAVGGAGTALSSALSANATGLSRNALAAGPVAVASGGAIYARRSDDGIAGSINLILKRTAA